MEGGSGDADEGTSEEPAPAEAEQEQEEENAEPREGEGEGEGEWQQMAVPMLPPGILAGMEVGGEGEREREREGPFEAQTVLRYHTSLGQMGPKLINPLHWSPFSWVFLTSLWHYPVEEHYTILQYLVKTCMYAMFIAFFVVFL